MLLRQPGASLHGGLRPLRIELAIIVVGVARGEKPGRSYGGQPTGPGTAAVGFHARAMSGEASARHWPLATQS